MAERITALFVKHTQRPGKYPDGGNLYLQIRKSTRNIETDAAYRRGDLFEKRARLMTDWARLTER